MAERLGVIRQVPQQVLDWSAFLGGGAAALRAAYPKSGIVAVEPSPDLLARSAPARDWRFWQRAPEPLAADAVPPASAQLLWANMALHFSPDAPGLMAQWQRALAVDGFLMFSTLGPYTLRELGGLYADAGWGPAQAPLTDMHDLGDALVHAGFADPVMDQEMLTLTWSSPQAALDELRQLGANAHPARRAGLSTPRWRQRLLDALAARADAQGRIALGFEVVYGHAFRPAPRARLGGEEGVSVDELRRSLVQRRTDGGRQ